MLIEEMKGLEDGRMMTLTDRIRKGLWKLRDKEEKWEEGVSRFQWFGFFNKAPIYIRLLLRTECHRTPSAYTIAGIQTYSVESTRPLFKAFQYTVNVIAVNCHLWPVWLFEVLPHYLINGTIFGKLYW